jgi:phytol kinase
MDSAFFLNELILVLVLFGLYYVTGQLVRHKDIKVNYTRKINHMAIFFLPIFLEVVFDYQKSVVTVTAGLIISISTLIVFIRPLRERSGIVRTMFLSFDRPEDQPHTMTWLVTQYIAAAAVIIPLVMLLGMMNLGTLVFIPLLINGLGDGLAEPIGVRFGRIKYNVRARFTETSYQRSLEGSLCVFVAGVLSITAFYNLFSPVQFIAAVLMIPLATTVAEAYSPHTWDTPFIYGTAGILLISIVSLV